MDVERYIAKQALLSGKFFAPNEATATTTTTTSSATTILPKIHCGYTCNIYQRQLLACNVEYDSRAVVSLALLDWQLPVLQLYANKIPLMCVNVGRLQYTVDAFTYGGYNANAFSAKHNNDRTLLAMNFLLQTDIDQVAAAVDTSEPNARFSRLLHVLRSNGYEQYIFALGRHLDLDIDLTYCQSKTAIEHNTVFRYRRDNSATVGAATATTTTTTSTHINTIDRSFGVLSSSAARSRRATDSHDYRPKNGVLTVVNHENKWFVRTTQNYIINVMEGR